MFLRRGRVEEEEEFIRAEINKLTPEERLQYHRMIKKRVKDPDTYAVLNWFLWIGLHHFYLGRWLLGLILLVLFPASFFVSLMIGFSDGSWTLFKFVLFAYLTVVVWDLMHLFRAQIVVQNHNNKVMMKALGQVERKYAARS